MFFKNCLVLIIALAIRISLVQNIKRLPPRFPRCYRDDPNLNECMLKATDQVRPFLRKGVPELDMPAIDPFYIPEITLEQGTNAVDYQAAFTNVVIKGLDNYRFKTFEYDVNKVRWDAFVEVDDLKISAEYKVNGKILTVRLEGKGKVQANVTNSNATVTVFGQLVQSKDAVLINVPKINVNLHIGDIKYTLDGLFDGNEVLAKAVRNVVRENLRELIEEVTPVVENVLVQILNGIITKSVGQVNYDDLYPFHNKTRT